MLQLAPSGTAGGSPRPDAGLARLEKLAAAWGAAAVLLLATVASAGPLPLAAVGEAAQVRVNLYTASTQAEVSLDASPEGWTVVAWSSRRQEAGSSGVFARRLDPAGRPASHEIRVHATVLGA